MALVLDVDDSGQNITKGRAVVGSVSAIPNRSDKTDAALVGSRNQVEKQLNDAAQALADAADPADDLQGSAEYKRHLIGVFLKRAFIRALA
jgi:CO/xanthine dehydrogenase FAD-binding subunit